MKKIYFLIFAILSIATNINAQVGNYSFSESVGSYTALGGTNSSASGDDGIQNGISIGFNFVYGGTTYTHYCITTNGFIKLGSATTTINTGIPNYTNGLSNTATNRPLIAAIWDDNNRGTGAITYSTTGTAPNRILTVDWNNVNIGGDGSTSAANLASYQIKLYETSNVIEFIYAPTLAAAGTLTSSIGLNDATSFLSVTPGATSTFSNVTANDGIASTTNYQGKKFTFTPPSCSAPGGLSATAVTLSSATIGWTASPSASGGYEWELRSSGTCGSGSPIQSGTTAGLSVPLTGLSANTTYTYCVRSICAGPTNSGWNSGTFYTGYCAISGTSSTSFINDFVTSGGSTNISNTGSGYSTGGYGDFTAQVVTQQQGAVVNISGALYAGSDDGVAIWVDWNNNLTFEASENVYNSAAYLPAFPAVSFNVPATAPIGNHRMRIVIDYNSTDPSPCSFGFGRGEAEDYTISVTVGTACTGAPTGVTISPTNTTVCVIGGATFTVNTTSAGTGITYVWESSPAGANTWTPISGANTNTYTASGVSVSTDYHCILTCSGNSTTSPIATITLGAVPTNDECANAITVVQQPNAPSCASSTLVNTSCATSSANTSNSWFTSQDDDVWYKFQATTTLANININSLVYTSGTPVDIGISVYNDNQNCANVTSANELSTTLVPALITITSGSGVGTISGLTIGNWYTVRLLTSGTSSRATFGFCIMAPPAAPACVTNVTPTNGATGVVLTGGAASITWNAAAGATSYDVYFGTVNPPTALIGNILAPAVTASVTGLQFDSTYYWYIVPKSTGGPAIGCSSNTTSFTAQSAPANCVPSTTTGCAFSDRQDLFRIKGETTELNINTGTACSTNAYIDSTDHPVIITMARGKSYWGQAKAGTTGDYLTVWIDANDNGLFENSERLLNNLPMASAAPGNLNVFIPLTMALGNHRLRARLVYYSSAPTTTTTACGFYTYSDTRDYTVNIAAGGAAYSVSTYASTGSCYTGGGDITVDAASNNNINYVPLVDSANALIAQLYPQGNNLGRVTTSYYKHNGPVRQNGQARYYLDRNLTISVATQPTTPYNLRFAYENSELNALIAQPGSGISSQFDLVLTKNGDPCLNAIGNGGSGSALFFPTGFGSISGGRFVDITNITGGFSSFYLHGGSTVLPVSIEYFKGSKQATGNLLDWKVTCTSAPTVTLSLERSGDGANFKAINTQDATATRCLQAFDYTDASPLAGANYYRLKATEPSGKFYYSAIVVLLNKEKGFELISIAPNPVKHLAILSLSSAKAGKIEIVVTDIAGRVVAKQNKTVIAGNNPIDMNFATLGAGTYTIAALNADGETKTIRFVKY